MEDYNSPRNIIPELISKIDEKKPDASILAFLKLNMVNQKIILNDLECHHISYLITICEKYNLKYEIIGFTKKLLIINNSSHKLFDDNNTSASKMGYTFLNKPSATKKYDHINSTEISDYLEKYNILNKTDIGDISKYLSDNRDISDNNYDEDSFEEDTDDETNNCDENINDTNINEQESSEDSEDSEEDCESDESSNSYTSKKVKGVIIDYNNIFTKGENMIYIISTMNLICNICIMNKLYFS
tara:strand:+ start:617 stop:1348 length:732 start_codon:yes stop_codon:yes gene_type:complete